MKKVNKFIKTVAVVALISLILGTISFFSLDFNPFVKYIKAEAKNHEANMKIMNFLTVDGKSISIGYKNKDYDLESATDTFEEKIEDLSDDLAEYILDRTGDFLDKKLKFSNIDIENMVSSDATIMYTKNFEPTKIDTINIYSKDTDILLLQSKNDELETYVYCDEDDMKAKANAKLDGKVLSYTVKSGDSDAKLYILVPSNFNKQINVVGTGDANLIYANVMNKLDAKLDDGECLIRYNGSEQVNVKTDSGDIDLFINKSHLKETSVLAKTKSGEIEELVPGKNEKSGLSSLNLSQDNAKNNITLNSVDGDISVTGV